MAVFATPASAQAPTGTLSGHVVSADGQSLPGVSVSVASPNLQGERTAVTNGNGDYLIPLLPPGDYTVSFEIGDFTPVHIVRSVAGNQTVLVDTKMSPAAVTESVTVVGKAQPFVETSQVATSFRQDLIATLPSFRTIDAVLLMAPEVHATGPKGNVTISGAQSYENLFTLNGAVITENLRGVPITLYIEDAIQETTVASAGVSAEYGRFEGGVASAVTKSGGNTFSGSFRNSFANDKWRSFTPFESTQLITNPALQLKTNKVVPTYEATMGGPIQKDRLWFFGAMRVQKQESTRTTVNTVIPYVRTNDDKRYEGKLTYTARPGHVLQAGYTKIDNVLKNNTASNVMDLASLTNQGQPQGLVSVHYTGVLRPNFFVEAQYSTRHLKLTDVGAHTTDRILGTMILDVAKNARFWSPTFCSGSVCDGDEQRNNSDVVLKGTYFLSDKTTGSHHVVFGYDRYNDNILANTHGSGSDFRIRATGSIIQGTDIYPQFINNNTQIEWDPLFAKSVGTHLLTHSAFVNDNWRLNNHFSFGVGLRLDKNNATDGSDKNVGDKASLSPRLSAIWDPKANGTWSVTGSYSRYVMALTNNVAGAATAAGNLATFRWRYLGPSINADPTAQLIGTADALTQLFNWFDANGGTLGLKPYTLASVPGVNTTIQKPLTSPYSNEYSGGVSRTLGSRGSVRVDGTFREYKNFYGLRTDLTTGTVGDGFGNTIDLSYIENTNAVRRRYASLVTQAGYTVGRNLDLGVNYTLSHAYGNFEGETANGPTGTPVISYPEYKQSSWNAPQGDLMIDQRHRARVWATYQVPLQTAGTLTFGMIQQVGSGTPYGALTNVLNPTSFVTNPGYAVPPGAVDYYFTNRDAFHTEATYRTDFSVNYNYRIHHAAGVQPEVFFHGDVINLFNQFQLCGCGNSVFNPGGNTDLTTINTAAALIAGATFNPFTTTPVEGVNWAKSPTFGQALNAFAYTSPRTLRFSVGVRF